MSMAFLEFRIIMISGYNFLLYISEEEDGHPRFRMAKDI